MKYLITMSKFFDINDLIVCEVQKVNKSGSAALHTRNDKYGKLLNGILCCVRPDLMEPMKTRFITKGNINLICGANGYIWISCNSDLAEDLAIISRIRSMLEVLNFSYSKIDFDDLLSKAN